MFLHIAVPRPLDEAFIYQCPPELEGQVSVGKRVIIPFGRQKVTGYIIDTSTTLPPTLSHKIGKKAIKPIDRILDAAPLMDETMLALCRWASDYYLFPIGKEIIVRGPPAEGKHRLIHQRSSIKDTVYRLDRFLPYLVRKSRGKSGRGIYNISGNLLPAKGYNNPLTHADLAFQFRRALIDECLVKRPGDGDVEKHGSLKRLLLFNSAAYVLCCYFN